MSPNQQEMNTEASSHGRDGAVQAGERSLRQSQGNARIWAVILQFGDEKRGRESKEPEARAKQPFAEKPLSPKCLAATSDSQNGFPPLGETIHCGLTYFSHER